MNFTLNASIWLTEEDYARLKQLHADLCRDREQARADALEEILDLARVVSSGDVPHDVVTMNSKVRFEDTRTGSAGVVTVVFPADADAADGRISVLSPVGAALLGLAEGDEIELPLPRGQTRHIRIVNVLYQPERGETADAAR